MWLKYGLKAQKLQKQHALKGQKLLAQGVWGHDGVLMSGACGAYMRNLSFL